MVYVKVYVTRQKKHEKGKKRTKRELPKNLLMQSTSAQEANKNQQRKEKIRKEGVKKRFFMATKKNRHFSVKLSKFYGINLSK